MENALLLIGVAMPLIVLAWTFTIAVVIAVVRALKGTLL